MTIRKVTVVQMLRNAGYVPAGRGKWWHRGVPLSTAALARKAGLA